MPQGGDEERGQMLSPWDCCLPTPLQFLVQGALLGWFRGLMFAKALMPYGVNFNVCLIN